MKQLCKKIAAIGFFVCLLLGVMPQAQAVNPAGSFYFTVMTANQTVVEPVAVPYTAGQTVLDAIISAGYELEMIEDGSIIAINGVEAVYLRYYDNGGYALDAPASDITAMMFCVNDVYSEPMIQLICAMGRYNEATNHVQNDPASQTAYNKALTDMRNANASTAQTLCDTLTAAMDAYQARLNGPKYTVSFRVTQAGKTVSNPAVILTDNCGNVTEGKGNASVVAGEYTYVISDGGCNRTEGTLTVSANTTVTAELPSGQWFGDVNVLNGDHDKVAFAKEQTGNHVTWYVDDTAGGSSLYLNAQQGDVPDVSTKLYAIYVDTQGIDRSSSYRSWQSTTVQLPSLVETGMDGRSFTLEARYEADGFTMVQTMSVDVVRVPTLKKLALSQEDSPLYLPFEPSVTEYSMRATADMITIDAQAFTGEGTTVTVNGAASRTVNLSSGKNAVQIQVTHIDGQSRTYHLNIEKLSPATVNLQIPSGVEAQIRNLDGNAIQPKGSSYQLIPGDTYQCISTKNTWYHAVLTFTAENGQSITAPIPDTTDYLSDLRFYNKSAVSSRTPFALDSTFRAANHAYSMEILDTTSAIYVQATDVEPGDSSSSQTVTANYLSQSLTASKCGLQTCIQVKYPVSDTGATTYLTTCLAQSGFAQTITMEVRRTISDSLVQYQEYEIILNRQLQLQSLACTVDGEKLDLLDEKGDVCKFSRTQNDYYLQVLTSAKNLNLAAAFPNEASDTEISGGYYALVDGKRYESLADVTIDLTDTFTTRDITIQVCHQDETAVERTYTLHVKKVAPVQVSFQVAPEDAVVFVINNKNGAPVYAENGTFALIPGNAYTYNVTCSGYIGKTNTRYIVPEKDTTVMVSLTKSAENTTLREMEAEWPSFRQSSDNNGIVDVASPVTEENAVLYWANKVGLGWYGDACGCPILVDDYIYIYAGTCLHKIDKVSGKIVATGQMDHTSNFSITNATYGGGMIFVGLSDGSVQAFNADTLESLWIYRDALGGQPNCPIAYHDGYLYTGFWKGESLDANFVCLSATDEDPTQTMEEKIATWTYTATGGFYWAGAYVNDDFVLIGTDDGQSGNLKGYATLACLDTRTGAILSEIKLPHTGDVRCSITYDSTTNQYYFVTKGGYFYGVKVSDDGVIDANGLRSIRLQNGTDSIAGSGSTPTIYNGRAYVGVGGSGAFTPYSGHNITVIDLKNWEIAYRVQTEGNPQTSGVLTTAYDKGDGTVYVYFLDNYTPGKLRVLCDRPGQSQPMETITEIYKDEAYEVAPVLFTPYGDQTQYVICSPIIDSDGTIYFKNDSGYLMALGSPAVSLELTTEPDKLNYQEGETFDATGMQVMATYANGTTRNVTSALTWNTDALTTQDTEFELILPMMYQNRDGQAGQKVDSLVLTLNLTVKEADNPVPLPVELPFTDVAANVWYHDEIAYVYENGLMNGVSATAFAPNISLSRAMFITTIYRLEGSPKVTGTAPYTDLEPGRWYMDAVVWGTENGIVKGNAGLFQPNDSITREQMAAIMQRYAAYKGIDISARADISSYNDSASVSSWAKENVQWAVSVGLFNGNDHNELSPKNNATRAEAAAVLHRFAENVLK